MTSHASPALIGLDWGTSSLRAALVDARGHTIEIVDSHQGILQVPGGDFEAVFEAKTGAWVDRFGPLPIVASGMIGSRNGWVEVPYLALPAGPGELAAALHRHDTGSGRAVWFVPGLLGEGPSGPDVMRGEETEIAGHCAASGTTDGGFVLPGTHSKWARVVDGRVVAFTTYMTGEVFAALKDHTILGRLAKEAPFDETAFTGGVRAGLALAGSAGRLLGAIFSARTLPLTGRLAPEAVLDHLSGLLIGAEVADGLAGAGEGSLVVVGRGGLAERYRIALGCAGRAARISEPGAAARGQAAIAAAAGLIQRSHA